MSSDATAVPDRARAPAAIAVIGAAVIAAVAFGALAGAQTAAFAWWVALGAVVLIALFAPLTALSLLLFVAVLLPFSLQNEHAISGGVGVPGILLIDVIFVVALARVSVVHYARRGLDAPALAAFALLALAAVQMGHGILSDAEPSDAGLETRHVVMAMGSFLLAAPLLENPVYRRRLPGILLAVALALGAWGLGQWFLHAPFNGSDFGVRAGRFGTTSGSGQLQGGLFLYHVAVIMAFAALASGQPKGTLARVLTATALAANALCLFFTYERTFWIVAVVGCAFVLARATPAARRRALRWAPPLALALIIAVAAISPADLLTAFERGASVSQANEDVSLEYRRVESELVMAPIRDQPFAGSGFGVQFTWEPPGFRGKELTTGFVHNGYLWLSWKAGIPFTIAVVLALIASIARGRPESSSLLALLRTGAQGSLLALLLVNITFPSFNALSIAVVTGVLVAMCWVPRRFSPPKLPEPPAPPVVYSTQGRLWSS